MPEDLHTNLANIIYVYEVLNKYSDVDHILSVKKIISYIEEKYNERIEDRTVRRNINVLIKKLGVDISTFTENRKGYYLRTRTFEKNEIQILLGMIENSNIIDDETSEELIKKLKKFLNKHDLKVVNNFEKCEILQKNKKTMNAELLKKINVLNGCIKSKVQVEFEYFSYGLDKKLHKVAEKRVSPYAIVYENDNFYLIAKDLKLDGYSYFEIDKIMNIATTNILVEKPILNVDEFLKSSMYRIGGKTHEIGLKCDMVILDEVIETFGDNVSIDGLDDYYFEMVTNANIEAIEMWIMKNINYIEVLYPDILKDNIRENLKKALDNYSDENKFAKDKKYLDKKEIMKKAREILKEEIPDISYSSWINDLDLEYMNGNKIVLGVSSELKKDALESKYVEVLFKVFKFITKKKCEIEIIVR